MSARGFLLAAALAAALLLAVGCGSSGSDTVTVETGSLSKAAFIKKADAICKAAWSEFFAEYGVFFKAHESDLGDESKERAMLGEVVDTLLAPNVEGAIKQISELGAPNGYATEAASYLNALQKRLGEMRAEPAELTAGSSPFKNPRKAAEKAGLQGCAKSFS